MKLKIVVHEAEEGGFWAEAPALPGCASEGETLEELLENVREAIAGCLPGVVMPVTPEERDRVIDITV